MGLFGGSSKSNSTTNATEQILQSGAVGLSASNNNVITTSDPAVAKAAIAASGAVANNAIYSAQKALEAASAELGQTARVGYSTIADISIASGKNITDIGEYGIGSIKALAIDSIEQSIQQSRESGVLLAEFASGQTDQFTTALSQLKRQELAGDLATAENITKYVVAGVALIAIAFIYKGSR
jgi:hypothetical protein